jgi:peptidoglycan/LPS O-acetylase OafA/YrhL
MLQMIDYTGKAVDDMGNYDGCQELPSDIIQYCVASTRVGVSVANETVAIYMGMCAPAMCNSTMLQSIMYKYINMSSIYIPSNLSIRGELADLGVQCIGRGWHQVTPGAIIGLLVAAFFALLVLSGTMLEYVDDHLATQITRRHRYSALPTEDRKPLLNATEETKRIESTGSAPAEPTVINGEYIAPKRRPGKLAIFLKCFAIKSNLEFLLKDNRSSELGLAPMNGLRCLMMFWIILGHTFGYLNTPVGFDNSINVTKHVVTRVSFQVVGAAELAVDVFFYLSGFLVVYMVLKEMKNSKKPIPWGLFYFHRYWRLTPVYGFIILFYTTLTPLMIYGPFSYLYRGMKTDLCDKYWWTNLLYINNFYPTNANNQCLGWGWYLANDMQFFIFSPLIILLFKKSRPLAGLVLVLLYAICIILVGVLTNQNHLRPLDPGDAQWNTIVYTKPYTRVAPYLIGIGFAFLVQFENFDLLRKWYVRWAVYVLCGTASTLSTYLTYGFWRDSGWQNWQNVLYATTARSAFVFATGTFMYACFKGHGGVLRSILSVYMWVPIARLTYTAYLVHPIIMFVINFSATTSFHYSAIYASVRYSAHILMAYVLGLILHLAIEKPTANLERLLLPPRKH